jgi:nucleoside-diphosphate-sugar epimerase
MVEVLHEAGHRIRATDLPGSYDQDDLRSGRFPSVLKKLNVKFIAADITKPETLNHLMDGVDYLFHIAAIFSYSAPWELLYRVNVEGTRHLLELVKQTPTFKKLMLWSAGGVYRSPKGPGDLPFREDSPIEPTNNYLKSKWGQECLVRDVCRANGIRYSVMRPTGVYGHRAIYGVAHMIREVMKPKKLMLPKNFTFRIPTVHVRDVCRAALYLAEHPETDGEAYNLNDDSQTSTVQYFAMMARLTGKPFKVLPPVPIRLAKAFIYLSAALGALRKKLIGGKLPRYEKDSVPYIFSDFVFSNEKLKKAGFQFQYPDFEKGLKETLPWYREHYQMTRR